MIYYDDQMWLCCFILWSIVIFLFWLESFD